MRTADPSDELFVKLRQALLGRARDKEAVVRVQAALGIAFLQDAEGEEADFEMDEQGTNAVMEEDAEGSDADADAEMADIGT